MKSHQTILVWFLVLAYLMGQVGCITGRYGHPKPEPLPEKYRAQLGTIGVVSVPGVPDIQLDRPLLLHKSQPGVIERMGWGAEKSWQWWKEDVLEPMAKGAGSGGVAGLAVVLTLFILTVPVTIFGGLGGAIYGAFPPGEPPEYEETEAILRHTLANYPIQKTLQSSFLNEARGRISHTFVDLSTDEEMAEQGVASVLELSVQRIGLQRVDDQEGEKNPPMVLALVVRARLFRGTEKIVWYDQTFVHETKSRLYEEWPHYYRLQTDIEKACQKLAEQMVEQLFLSKPTTYPYVNPATRSIFQFQ